MTGAAVTVHGTLQSWSAVLEEIHAQAQGVVIALPGGGSIRVEIIADAPMIVVAVPSRSMAYSMTPEELMEAVAAAFARQSR